MRIKKSRKLTPERSETTKRTAEESLAWAAGTEQFRHRDPLYHVTESFQQTFDRIGRSHAMTLTAGFSQEELREEENRRESEQRRELRQPERTGGEKKRTGGEAGPAGRENGVQKLWTGNMPSALTRFSDTAFQRGAMSASVLNGTGKMMLISCLKRTVGQSGPKRIQQQDLLQTGSQVRNIPGRSPDQMVFNRSFAKGALGIVVDTIRDARRVVDSMADMAQGVGELSYGEGETMRTMYPFLDISRDLATEKEYRDKLASCTDPREKPVLQNALVQVLSLKAKKTQMRNEFINKLRFLSDRATETLSELEAPGVLDEIVTSAWGDRTFDLPENPEEGAESGAPIGSENRGDAPGPEGRGGDTAE